jgi:hypothetical protein
MSASSMLSLSIADLDTITGKSDMRDGLTFTRKVLITK